MKSVRFIAEARREYLAEVRYYAAVEPGLGARFAQAVEDAVARVVAFPNIGTPSVAQTRRVIVLGFPFSVYYRLEKDELVVYAVSHHAREPNYWTPRV